MQLFLFMKLDGSSGTGPDSGSTPLTCPK